MTGPQPATIVHEAGAALTVGTSTLQDCARCGTNLISHGSVSWPAGSSVIKLDAVTTRQVIAAPNCKAVAVRISERVGDETVLV